MSRPKGMSLLDYLWTYFGNYTVSNKIGDTPNPNSIVTEEALASYLATYAGGIVKLQLFEKEGDPTKLELIGLSSSGETLTIVEFDKEDSISDIQLIQSTLVEVDNNICLNLDEPLLTFVMKSGKTYYINLSQFVYTGQLTKSIVTTITNGKILANLRLDDSIAYSCVNTSITDNGLLVDLVLKNQESDLLRLVKTNDGLETKYTWDDGNNILFQCLTFSEYESLGTPHTSGKVYFITDMMCIYLNDIRYGSSMSIADTSTIKAVYTENGLGFLIVLDPDTENLLQSTENGLLVKLTDENIETITNKVIEAGKDIYATKELIIEIQTHLSWNQ